MCEEPDTDERILEDLSKIADGVADKTGSETMSDIASADAENAGDVLLSAVEPKRIFADVLSYVSAGLPDACALLGILAGLLLLCALCNSVCEGISSAALKSGFEFCCAAAVMCAIVGTQYKSISLVANYFENMSSLMGSMIPITGVVWAMGGNVSTASVGTASLYALLTVLQRICAATVLPVCCVMGITALCSGLSDGTLLTGFGGAVKKTYNFVIGAIMTVLVFALGAQTSVASAADTVTARGAKLLSSTVIPVVGGAVGDTLRTVAGSVQYVKSVVGVGGILFVVYMTLPVFISVLLSRAVLLLSSGMAQMLGCKREARLLDELGNVYGCMLGAVSISAIAFCVAFAIFVKCTVAVS
jgi:stage III sporulation protein AE